MIRRLIAGGNQDSAGNYGSAFSRAAAAVSPAGHAVFISGTAAINEQGETNYAGNVRAQIEMTIDNVRAILSDMNCSDRHVVQAIVYCKTPEVEEAFVSGWGDLSWPHFTVIADICRDDLLFEVEATAARGRQPAF